MRTNNKQGVRRASQFLGSINGQQNQDQALKYFAFASTLMNDVDDVIRFTRKAMIADGHAEAFAEGQSCAKGERADLTGCIPADGSASMPPGGATGKQPQKAAGQTQPKAQPGKSATNPKTESTKSSVREAYNQLKDFVEYAGGSVAMPHMYHMMKQQDPSLTVDGFHAALEDMESKGEIEFQQLNEINDAKNPEHAIYDRERDNLYYFVVPKDRNKQTL